MITSPSLYSTIIPQSRFSLQAQPQQILPLGPQGDAFALRPQQPQFGGILKVKDACLALLIAGSTAIATTSGTAVLASTNVTQQMSDFQQAAFNFHQSKTAWEAKVNLGILAQQLEQMLDEADPETVNAMKVAVIEVALQSGKISEGELLSLQLQAKEAAEDEQEAQAMMYRLVNRFALTPNAKKAFLEFSRQYDSNRSDVLFLLLLFISVSTAIGSVLGVFVKYPRQEFKEIEWP